MKKKGFIQGHHTGFNDMCICVMQLTKIWVIIIFRLLCLDALAAGTSKFACYDTIYIQAPVLGRACCQHIKICMTSTLILTWAYAWMRLPPAQLNTMKDYILYINFFIFNCIYIL